MRSHVSTQAARTHAPFLLAVADAVGDEPFFAKDLRAQGVAVPPSQILRTLKDAGCLIKTGRVKTSVRWRLAPGVQEYLRPEGAR